MTVLRRMIRKLSSAGLAGLMVLSLLPLSALGKEETDHAEYNGFIVKATQRTIGVRGLKKAPAKVAPPDSLEGVEPLPGENLYLADTLEHAMQIPGREYIEPNYAVTLPDDPLVVGIEPEWQVAKAVGNGAENLLHLRTLNAVEHTAINRWDMDDRYSGLDRDLVRDMDGDGEGRDEIVIAVVDSGLIEDHPDMNYDQVKWADKSFLKNVDPKGDTMGHGTFIAGELLAKVGNGRGVDGLTPEVYVMPLRVFDENRMTWSTDVIEAIQYAVDQKTAYLESKGETGANICVINLSLSAPSASTSLKEVVDKAIDAGIIVICAAGNDGTTDATYPAQYAIGVGATSPDGGMGKYNGFKGAGSYTQVLSRENKEGWRNKVWVSAPGTAYSSLWYTGTYYQQSSGTSFAAPMVSALAAIAMSLNNDLTSYYTIQREGEDPVKGVLRVPQLEDAIIENNHLAFKRLLMETSNLRDYSSADSKEHVGGDIDGQDIRYGWGVADYAAVLSALTTVGVEISVRDEDDTVLTPEENGLKIRVFPYDEEGRPGNETVSPVEDTELGALVYPLERGKQYHYSITSVGYARQEGDLTIEDFSRYRQVVFQPERLPVYPVLFTELPEGAMVTVWDCEDNLVAYTDGACGLTVGEYTYRAEAEGCYVLEGSFTLADEEEPNVGEEPLELPLIMELIPTTAMVRVEVVEGEEPLNGLTIAMYEQDEEDTELSPLEVHEEGTWSAWELPAGEYRYTVSAKDYEAVTVEFTVTEEDLGGTIVCPVALSGRYYRVNFIVSPEEADATLIVRQGESQLAPGEDGAFHLLFGEYLYSVTAPGYDPQEDMTFLVEQDGEWPVDLVETTYQVTVTAVPSDAVITLQNSEGETLVGEGNGLWLLPSGTYFYIAESEGYEDQTGTLTVAGTPVDEMVTMIEKPQPVVVQEEPESKPEPKPEPGPEPEPAPVRRRASHQMKSAIEEEPEPAPAASAPEAVTTLGETSSVEAPGILIRPSVVSAVALSRAEKVQLAAKSYTDVRKDAWYSEPVGFVTAAGFFGGVGEEEFAPELSMTRAMLVTVLYRLDGAPRVHDETAYTDVEKDTWYFDPIAWAAARGIVSGDGEDRFAPDDPVLREQMAVMLYNYARYKGYDVTGAGDLSQFDDREEVDLWAEDGIAWANAEDLINGRPDEESGRVYLAPAGCATRGEVAAVIMRFYEKFVLGVRRSRNSPGWLLV